MFLYIFITSLACLLFTEDILKYPFEAFGGQFFKWFLSPALFIAFMVFGYYKKGEMRWLKDEWVHVTINQFWKFMINNHYKDK
jgi:hypothetical protein